MPNIRCIPVWLIVAFAVVCTVLVVTLYHNYTLREEARKAMHEAAAQAAAKQEAEKQAYAAQQLRLERLRQGISAAAFMRTEIAVYFADRGELPKTIDDFPNPPLLPNTLQAVEMAENGAFVFHFSPQSGLAGRIIFTPDLDRDNYFIRGWSCSSPDFAEIGQASEDCRFTAEKP